MTWACGLLASAPWSRDPGMSRPAPSPIYTLRGAGGPLNTLHFSCHGGDTPLLFSGLVIYLSIQNFDFSSSSSIEDYFWSVPLFVMDMLWEFTKLVLNFVHQRRNVGQFVVLHVICTYQASQSGCTSAFKTDTESRCAMLAFKAPHHTPKVLVWFQWFLLWTRANLTVFFL